jgi:nuclear RNA export factor
VNDMLTVRAFGGTQAFEPDNAEDLTTTTDGTNPNSNGDSILQLPTGTTMQMAEQMVIELQKQTNMTIGYSKDCLEQVGWDYQKALQAFAAVKDSLPADAFNQVL